MEAQNAGEAWGCIAGEADSFCLRPYGFWDDVGRGSLPVGALIGWRVEI